MPALPEGQRLMKVCRAAEIKELRATFPANASAKAETPTKNP
jgi:hypothetical protein